MTKVDWLIVALRVYGVYLLTQGVLAFPDIIARSSIVGGGAGFGFVFFGMVKVVLTIGLGGALFKFAPKLATLDEAGA